MTFQFKISEYDAVMNVPKLCPDNELNELREAAKKVFFLVARPLRLEGGGR